jgi:Flp pilus assembly protein TadB
MSAFMNVLSAPRIGAEQAVPESSSTTAVSAQPQKQQSAVDEIGKKQAVEVAQAVAKVQAPAVTTATPRRREARSRRTKEPSSTRRHEQSSSTAIKRSPLAMQEPPPAKGEYLIEISRYTHVTNFTGSDSSVDKMLFLFWLPVLAIAFVYTLVTTLPFTLGRALLGPILGPLTKLLKL